MVGTLRLVSPPSYGNCESMPLRWCGLGLFGERAARGAMGSAARSTGLRRRIGFRRLQQVTASPRIRSDHLIRTHVPHACDEEAVRMRPIYNGLVRPLGGTVIIHPAGDRGKAAGHAWLRGSVLNLHDRFLGHKPGGEVAPQRHDQLARQRDNGDAPGALAGVDRAGAEPAAEGAVGLMA